MSNIIITFRCLAQLATYQVCLAQLATYQVHCAFLSILTKYMVTNNATLLCIVAIKRLLTLTLPLHLDICRSTVSKANIVCCELRGEARSASPSSSKSPLTPGSPYTAPLESHSSSRLIALNTHALVGQQAYNIFIELTQRAVQA